MSENKSLSEEITPDQEYPVYELPTCPSCYDCDVEQEGWEDDEEWEDDSDDDYEFEDE